MVGYDQFQLAGYVGPPTSLAKKNCEPLYQLGNITLNPCGVIANTFFNDYFTLLSGNDATGKPLQMMEEGIAWRSDIEYVYKQPDGFHYENCSACDSTCCEGSNWSCKEPYVDQYGNCYRYYYPNDEKTQYFKIPNYQGALSNDAAALHAFTKYHRSVVYEDNADCLESAMNPDQYYPCLKHWHQMASPPRSPVRL